MGLLTPEIRERIVKAYKKGYKVKDIADMFDVHRWTVWHWVKRTHHPGRKNYRDRSRRPHRRHRKITPQVEDAILLLRDTFKWGTQRIRIALMGPPPYIRYLLETTLDINWKTVNDSRQAINNILRKRRRNGSPYKKNKKQWKFFRAQRPNELWQIDIKGPFCLDWKRLNAVLIIDDYSRFLLNVQLHPKVTTEIVTQDLYHCIKHYRKPQRILADNKPQFRERFSQWCSASKRKLNVEHALPFYPQCKGKIERCIRNFNEEFLPLDRVFENPETLVDEYCDGILMNDTIRASMHALLNSLISCDVGNQT
ncbi:MAG: transposase [Candidatus Thermoplasmatota archaeon]|nr:transposase [Candidatus Thermoplasmatota archaeon]